MVTNNTPVAADRIRVCVDDTRNESRMCDLTDALTQTIACELWRHTGGGNSIVNWIQAEAIVQRMAEAFNAAAPADRRPVPPASPPRNGTQPAHPPGAYARPAQDRYRPHAPLPRR